MIALSFPGQARAADDAGTSGDIVVSGQRETAIVTAQDDAINATSLTTIVSGEELRAQPQPNLADLLGRLPGLNSSVDQSRNAAATGEAQYLSIRGLDTAYNAYEFNGVRLAQTDARTRAISLNLLSPFGISQVRVEKAPTAAEDGDAIAGIVDLRTASPFELPAHHFQIRAQGQVAGRAAARDQDPWGGTVQLETAQTFGNFGIFASAYYGKKNVLSESTAFHKDYVKINNAIPGRERENLDNLTPRGVEWNLFRSRIERFGGSLNLEWKSDSTTLYSRTTYGEYRLKSWMDQTAIRQVDQVPAAANPNPVDEDGDQYYDANGFLALYGPGATYYFRTEHSNQSLFSSKLGGETRVGDLTLNYHAAYSKGTQDYPLRIQSKFGSPAYAAYDANGMATYRLETGRANPKAPQVVLDDAARAALTDLSTFKQAYVTSQFENTWERRWEGAFDAAWHMADEGLVSLQAGGKFESATHYANSLGSDGALQYDFADGEGQALNAVPGEVLNGFMNDAAQVPIYMIDTNWIEKQAHDLSLSKLPGIDPVLLEENRLRGVERRLSGYALATLKFGGLTLYPGVRFEHNTFKGTYWADNGDNSGFTTSSRSYNELLPSLIASYRPGDRTVLRFSARKSYSRPAFDLLLGPTERGYDEDGNLNYIFQPNPDLQATEAWNFDFSVEHKGAGSDMISASLYYKRLNHVLFSTGTTNASGDWNIWSNDTISPDGVEVSTLNTSAKGKVYGVELFGRYSFKGLPGLFDGLGVQGNLTLQRADAGLIVAGENRRQRMPQAPQVTFNAELFYNHGPASAALTYSYTGNKLYDLRSSQPDTYIQPVSTMNLFANYAITPRFTVGAAVQNVLDAHNFWSTAGESKSMLSVDRKGGYVETGRTYLLNLTYAM
ncbi:TonB-dependent receptor [Novosphingobium beihaiensis]|uniref:TonB-dependent receptor n=1 Tax=Novosphingobium beihaiensis TaxID=2930389 RepID=A0ABT0BW04_9SPHN|nr:TonB-dependent receptor [Novosphingobium beihaiensis]MCJ2189234.1 TonB-dependent receptor [Novosphingobium beihaiensis]